MRRITGIILLLITTSVAGWAQAELPAADASDSGTIRGVVTLTGSGKPVHNASVTLVPLGSIVETDRDGRFEFEQVPAGTYDVIVHLTGLRSQMQTVILAAGQTVSLELQLTISPIRDEITVTASGREQTAFDSVHSVHSLDSFDLTEKMAPTVGEVLEKELGVAKRSFGPGTSRPVIRGFDGDRVLIVQNGVRTGDVSSQSGDHGVSIDPAGLERLEVVKGPATLLYGSNAVGGVVNAVSRHQEAHQHVHEGVQGRITGVAGSNNTHLGGSASFDYGRKNFLFWGSTGGQRTGDYRAPSGQIENSNQRSNSGSFGFGWYTERGFWNLSYELNDGRYGVPFATEEEEEEIDAIDIDYRLHQVRFNGGINQRGFFESFQVSLSYSDWSHNEIEILPQGLQEIGTNIANKEFVYRGVFEQKKRGRLSGRFGFSGMHRQYEATGEEALAPPVDQNIFALFALEELDLEHATLQLGGRLEHNRYQPDSASPDIVERSFTGASAGAGARFPLWKNGAFAANFAHSFRVPALEELYNNGPHPGNVTFEIGNSHLQREGSNGLDLSLRHKGERLRLEANYFHYDIKDFVFLAPTGEVREGLIEARSSQGDSRFQGVEVGIDVALHEHLWLNLGLDAIDAKLTDLDTPLPRIPPLRGRVGIDLRRGAFSFRPELVLADAQEDLFPTETRTAGYTVVNLLASYTIPQQHFIHHLALSVFNLGDRLYRNHLSFIKDLAPEIGRGVRLTYTLRFF